jgi:hypothetical protein
MPLNSSDIVKKLQEKFPEGENFSYKTPYIYYTTPSGNTLTSPIQIQIGNYSYNFKYDGQSDCKSIKTKSENLQSDPKKAIGAFRKIIRLLNIIDSYNQYKKGLKSKLAPHIQKILLDKFKIDIDLFSDTYIENDIVYRVKYNIDSYVYRRRRPVYGSINFQFTKLEDINYRIIISLSNDKIRKSFEFYLTTVKDGKSLSLRKHSEGYTEPKDLTKIIRNVKLQKLMENGAES